MSWEAQAWSKRKGKDYELDATTRFVFRTLADYADPEGNNIFPSLSTLELDTGLSERTIRRSIKKLIAVGLLDYGDQTVVSENPRYRNDQLPKVYRFVFARDAAAVPDYSKVGKVRKRRPWSRKPKPAPAQPDPKPAPEPAPPAPPRPATVSRTPGQTPRHSDHQTFNPLNEPPAAVPQSPELIDYAAVLELRQAARDRLARRGITFPEPLHAPAPELTPVMQ
jgi:hypothetical protein